MKINPKNPTEATGNKRAHGHMHRILPHLKVFSVAVIAVLTTALALIGICALGIYRDNEAPAKAGLSKWMAEGVGERVLIFAPHEDDETLACGGLIQRLCKNGAKVLLVVATNGDGFRVAVSREFHEIDASSNDFVQFGYIRQNETVKAVGKLGLPSNDIIFLGYPDRGLSHMWLENWTPSDPLKSSYTDSDHSPYKNAYHAGVSYCGESLLADLKQVLLSFKPTAVYYPHTWEQHPDHWAAGCYMTQALYELGMLDKVRTGLYMVHRGDWPVPQGLHQERCLVPPPSLSHLGTNWHEFDLTRSEEDRKLDAIRTYTSQTNIMSRFLLSFDRTNEMFGTYPAETVEKVESIGRVSDPEWQQIEPSVLDPTSDSISKDMAPSGDVHDIRCCYDAANFYVRLGLAHRYGYRMIYDIHLHPIGDEDAMPVNVKIQQGRSDTAGVRTSVGTDAIEIAVPQSMLGNWKAVMVSADSFLRTIQIDRTAWRLLEREGEWTVSQN